MDWMRAPPDTAGHPGITGGGQSHVLPRFPKMCWKKMAGHTQCFINLIYINRNIICIFLTVNYFRLDKDRKKKVITIHKPSIQRHRPNMWVYILLDFCLYMYTLW